MKRVEVYRVRLKIEYGRIDVSRSEKYGVE